MDSGIFTSFHSSDESIATVDNDGLIKAVSSGTAIITKEKLWDKEEYKIRITNPSIEAPYVSVLLGETYVIKINNADKIQWNNNFSSNNYFNQKSDTQEGLFFAESPGDYEVSANADGKVLTCQIHVPEPKLEDITLSKGKESDIPSQNVTENAKLISSDEDVASIQDGKIIGKNVGTATLSSTINGTEIQSLIKVEGNQNIEIQAHDSLPNQKQEIILSNVIPSYKVEWKGVKQEDGKVFFEEKEEGDYTVSATVDMGIKKETITKTIKVRDVIEENEKKLYIGETFTLSENPDIEYDYDKEFFQVQDNVFTVLKNGNTLIHAYKDDVEETCDISIGDGGKGDDVVAYAMQFLGNPYVYGGSSLTNGTDCSGFIMRVYEQFGIFLPHSSSSQRSYGTEVGSLEDAKAGDVICYNGHVALYMGNNRIIHASTPSTGIKISDNAAYRNIVTIRRFFE